MNKDTSLWPLFHRYGRLVRRDIAQPILCDACGSQVITRMKPPQIDTAASPRLYLWCYSCATFTEPSVSLIIRVRAMVEEHFVD